MRRVPDFDSLIQRLNGSDQFVVVSKQVSYKSFLLLRANHCLHPTWRTDVAQGETETAAVRAERRMHARQRAQARALT